MMVLHCPGIRCYCRRRRGRLNQFDKIGRHGIIGIAPRFEHHARGGRLVLGSDQGQAAGPHRVRGNVGDARRGAKAFGILGRGHQQETRHCCYSDRVVVVATRPQSTPV